MKAFIKEYEQADKATQTKIRRQLRNKGTSIVELKAAADLITTPRSETVDGALVEIVYDDKKGKLRAKPVNKEGWVRFPKKLRQEGKLYSVSELRPGKGGSWIAVGEIKEVA